MQAVRIVNVADIAPGDRFVNLTEMDGAAVEWVGHSGIPANFVERVIRRPRLSRYRAAWNAISDARNADLIISHLPRMTAMVEHLAKRRNVQRPHLAFSFNFTDLPEGMDLARLTRAFARVDRFCVYSQYEAELYPRLFDLPADRFRAVFWGQDVPVFDQAAPAPAEPFVIAIGGEGRDYDLMVAAARENPKVRWLVIARPSAAFADAPANMTVRYNVPAPLTWGLAKRAAAVVVPLKTDRTCCGHITIAGAQLLGLPLITSRSAATREYVEDMPGTVVVEPGDVQALANAAANAIDCRDTAAAMSENIGAVARQRYDRDRWIGVIRDFIRDTRH